MINTEELQKIKLAVSQPLNWEAYKSTNVQNVTNCFAHAIGCNIPYELTYWLGNISNKKSRHEDYKSCEELRKLFLADLAVLNLCVKEIKFEELSKEEVIKYASQAKLDSNQYLVTMFATIYNKDGQEMIRDFHFIRYDQEVGWSEKKIRHNVRIFKNILAEWPSNWYDKLIGVYQITRNPE